MTKRRDAGGEKTPPGSKRDAGSKLGRRNFLKGATLGGAAAMASAPLASASAATPNASTPKPRSDEPRLSTNVHPLTSELECAVPPLPPAAGPKQQTSGSDFMIDAMRACGIKYVAAIPGNTFKSMHESVINYGMLTEPEMRHLTITHEEAAVAMAHGYFKVSGKPMAALVHGVVGLQHATMALYNAYCDRVPLFCFVGVRLDAAKRTTPTDWLHTAFDGPSLTREFTKWDDTPGSLTHFGESMIRSYKFAMTPPYGPIVLGCDQDLQEMDVPSGQAPLIPKLTTVLPPVGEDSDIREAAKMLVAAENPIIVADRASRTPEGMKLVTELAETLQAGVIDQGGRMNFPWRHPLNVTFAQELVAGSADCVIGLELTDFYFTARAFPKTAKKISINSADLFMKSTYQEFERYAEVDLAIAADAEATLPLLLEAVKREMAANKRSSAKARGAKLAEYHNRAVDRTRQAWAVGWDGAPISVGRMTMELYDVIRKEDWGLTGHFADPTRLWDGNEHYRHNGASGGSGVGYDSTSSLGAALGHQEQGRIAIAMVGDGDMMMSPGVMWTAAHERLPVLYVVHNNHAWNQELIWVQGIAGRRSRGATRCGIGNTMQDPYIDFGAMAKSMGMYGETVKDPKDLGAAYRRAVDVVKKGEPALVDVWSQPR
jgi:thiamine pyrophosphate-dependent acetolactate synthase large subunit-like protein